MTAVVLLDIDGVINAFEPPWQDTVKSKCAGLTIRWAPAVVERLRALHEVDGVEMYWASTWCGYADMLAALGALIGLDLPSAFADRPRHRTWGDLKVEAAVDTLARGRRVVWVDDDEVSAGREFFPVLAEAERDGRALLVQPDSRHGLTAAHLDEIEAFAYR